MNQPQNSIFLPPRTRYLTSSLALIAWLLFLFGWLWQTHLSQTWKSPLSWFWLILAGAGAMYAALSLLATHHPVCRFTEHHICVRSPLAGERIIPIADVLHLVERRRGGRSLLFLSYNTSKGRRRTVVIWLSDIADPNQFRRVLATRFPSLYDHFANPGRKHVVEAN